MFETLHNEDMEAEVKRLEAKQRAVQAGHPEWDNACASCGGRLQDTIETTCESCS